MAVQGWPYAVARGVETGYQVIALPGFLAENGEAYLLEYASRAEPGEPDAVTVREVLGASASPLTLAYRVVEAEAGRYGLSGREQLRDRTGRIIRVFEGLVLGLPAERVASLGLTDVDLDTVTSAITPAFRKLLTATSVIEADPTMAISVGSGVGGTGSLPSRIAEPYLVPGGNARQLAPARTARRTRQGAPPQARPRRTVLAAAAGLAIAVLLVAWGLISRRSPGIPQGEQSAISSLCTKLHDGEIAAAYQLFTYGYQHSTSLGTFESRLLGHSSSATCTSTTTGPQADEATVALQRADGQAEKALLSLQPGTASSWQFTQVNPLQAQ
jgi:hypothetical protein